MTNLLLAAALFMLANLQKNPLTRIFGRFLAALAVYYALSSSLAPSAFRNLWNEIKTGRPSAEKISSKIMPKEVSSGQKSISKALKEVSDSIK
ncbi:MAG: hypothetical protein CVU77_04730 [Elusimicrobia bacterium HGW-Elusimicrobia-1]|jgi:hypothetical protein|nr:MAG: hypothetical protein CVU77_04730 [Elusimicrobia bacterium HGW-Elusimicrobia-1]